MPRRRYEFVAAAGIAEADDLPPVERQAVRADRLAGPRTDVIDAIFEAKLVGQLLGLLSQLLGLGNRFVDSADHVEGRLGKVVVFAVDHRLE